VPERSEAGGEEFWKRGGARAGAIDLAVEWQDPQIRFREGSRSPQFSYEAPVRGAVENRGPWTTHVLPGVVLFGELNRSNDDYLKHRIIAPCGVAALRGTAVVDATLGVDDYELRPLEMQRIQGCVFAFGESPAFRTVYFPDYYFEGRAESCFYFEVPGGPSYETFTGEYVGPLDVDEPLCGACGEALACNRLQLCTPACSTNADCSALGPDWGCGLVSKETRYDLSAGEQAPACVEGQGTSAYNEDCYWDRDCAGEAPLCAPFGDVSLTCYRPYLPDLRCTRLCETDLDCPEGDVCLDHSWYGRRLCGYPGAFFRGSGGCP
jgi:hypothetical protein